MYTRTRFARAGATLIELLIVLVVCGIVVSMGVLRAAAFVNRVAVHAAGNDLVAAFAMARDNAVHRSRRHSVTFDTASASVRVRADSDTLLVRNLGDVHGVHLAVSRDSMAYSANGLGYGAANLQVVVSRGSARETVVVSRLGRVRR
jgi:prepilin-type N-terminal cleavage/methylation domain-containing protein